MRKYDLVAIDLDGTLVDAQNSISEGVERALQEVRSEGIKVVLVSGRPQVAAFPIFEKLGLGLPLISSGGAYVIDLVNGTLIAEFQPPVEDIHEVVRLARAAGLTIVFQRSDAVYCEGNAEILAVLRAAVRVPIAHVEDGLLECPEPIKISLCGPREELDRIDTEIKRRGLALSMVLSGPEYLEITAQGVSKGEALKRVAEYLRVPLKRIVAIGDAHNDISMFEVAGLGVAMGNAPPDVQAAADVVAPTIQEDGVAWALRNLLFDR
jgi:Cof subfamily protein (haloacid dehalogenase superfamily)